MKSTFPELTAAKPKKFEKNVRKASKTLLAGLAVKIAAVKKEKPAKKTKSGKKAKVAVLVEQPEVAAVK
ncbi:MAG: hypothetical protein EOO09_17660 [Chitinophagaceae bacterium]|nr:MAG: hypothetical protein EOO09_17660 [Chitinophagaceae bacterium]